MRMMLCSCAAAMGAGGVAVMGAAPDFDRTINRSPEAVYAAFSAVSPEVRETVQRTADTPELVASVQKEANREIRFEVLADGDEVIGVTVNFEPAKGGTATRVTAELDIDQRQLRALEAFGPGKDAYLPRDVPEAMVDMAFASLMQEMVSNVEAGRPLDSLGGSSARALQSAGAPSPREARAEASARQRQASRPMNRAAPIVDPNEAARNYMEGGRREDPYGEEDNGWGRH